MTTATIRFQSYTAAVPPHFQMPSSSLAFRRLSFAFPRRPPPSSLRLARVAGVRAFSSPESGSEASVSGEKVTNKPPVCTADELHYVSVRNSDWRLALWRYHPSPQAQRRNHPLLLLSGVGTNAIGYDLSPESSFARYMCGQGFDTWILEVRGAGLSIHGSPPKEIEQSAHAISQQMETAATSGAHTVLSATNSENAPTEPATNQDPTGLATNSENAPTEPVINQDPTGLATNSENAPTEPAINQDPTGLATNSENAPTEPAINQDPTGLATNSENAPTESDPTGLATVWEESVLVTKLTETFMALSERVQRSVSPPLFDLQERLAATVGDFQKQMELMVKYDWDFEHYLEEDVPAAMEYIRALTQPKDGKLVAVGHSMGGILLYSMLSRFGSEGREPGFTAVVTLASSLDYTSSKSSLKLLIPLADPVQSLNVPAVPLGALLTAVYPLTSQPPYVLSWLNHMISAKDMMHPELLKKLVLNNFCTIPAKLLLQLTSAFREGGLCDRSGTFFYKHHIHKIHVPILAVAGDRDAICPPEAVEETLKQIPDNLVTYKLFGEPDGPHYAHYDLVGGRLAVEQVYPCIVEFLIRHDSI